MPYIKNSAEKHSYKAYKHLAKQAKKSNVAGVIIKASNHIEVIPVMKKTIGATMIENEIFFIDSDGNLFQSEEENCENYVTVSGEYKYWARYYEELEKYPNILKKIYHAHIYHYRVDLYVLPGVLVKLNRCIKDLNDFYETYPHCFEQKNYYIDLRNTKRIGYAHLEVVNTPKLVE